MKEPIESRLNSLKAEFKAGQEILAELETRQANVRNTLMRISGAIQVLEELLRDNGDGQEPGAVSAREREHLAVA